MRRREDGTISTKEESYTCKSGFTVLSGYTATLLTPLTSFAPHKTPRGTLTNLDHEVRQMDQRFVLYSVSMHVYTVCSIRRRPSTEQIACLLPVCLSVGLLRFQNQKDHMCARRSKAGFRSRRVSLAILVNASAVEVHVRPLLPFLLRDEGMGEGARVFATTCNA